MATKAGEKKVRNTLERKLLQGLQGVSAIRLPLIMLIPRQEDSGELGAVNWGRGGCCGFPSLPKPPNQVRGDARVPLTETVACKRG